VEATHPKDTDCVPRTIRGTIWLDHAEHAMELPADEKYDKKMMRVPKAFEMGALPLLHGKVDHDAKDDGHDPTSSARPGGKVGLEEGDKPLATCLCTRICEREFGKVDHVRENVNDSADNNRPGSGLVEGNALVKGDDLVEWCATEEGDKIAADGEEDEDDIDVQNKGSGTGDGWEIEFGW
jgi:hypothetical protein